MSSTAHEVGSPCSSKRLRSGWRSTATRPVERRGKTRPGGGQIHAGSSHPPGSSLRMDRHACRSESLGSSKPGSRPLADRSGASAWITAPDEAEQREPRERIRRALPAHPAPRPRDLTRRSYRDEQTPQDEPVECLERKPEPSVRMIERGQHRQEQPSPIPSRLVALAGGAQSGCEHEASPDKRHTTTRNGAGTTGRGAQGRSPGRRFGAGTGARSPKSPAEMDIPSAAARPPHASQTGPPESAAAWANWTDRWPVHDEKPPR